MTIPLISVELVKLTPEQEEMMYWDNLKFQSHKWIEYQEGYYRCMFCGHTHTSMMPTNFHSMCKENPNI